MKSRTIFLIAGIAALLTLPTKFVAAASLDELLAKRKPEAMIDLATKAGAQLVRGEWRYSDTKIVEVDFKAAGADGQPGDTPNKTYDFTPHAGGADFDDSKWEVIDPTTLEKRRSAGRLAFNWYRIKITVPERVGNFNSAGSTLVFATSIDDYAERSGWMESCRALSGRAAVQSSRVGTLRTG
jgi:gluconolactonase